MELLLFAFLTTVCGILCPSIHPMHPGWAPILYFFCPVRPSVFASLPFFCTSFSFSLVAYFPVRVRACLPCWQCIQKSSLDNAQDQTLLDAMTSHTCLLSLCLFIPLPSTRSFPSLPLPSHSLSLSLFLASSPLSYVFYLDAENIINILPATAITHTYT